MTSERKEPQNWQDAGSTAALCLVAFTHSYLLISVFPYSGFMALDLIPSVNAENAGSYAGLLASSFMIGRTLTSYGWGKAADTYGRVAVIQTSLALSAILTLLFGLSPTFLIALTWRFLLGLSNGLVAAAKTCVSELAGGDRTKEANDMNLVMSMWGGAFLIAPAISGAFCDPLKQYPGVNFGTFRTFLDEYPFFGPNLVGASLCFLSLVLVHFFVRETLPSHKLRPAAHIPYDTYLSLKRLYLRALSTVSEEADEYSADTGETMPIMSTTTPLSYDSELINDTEIEVGDDDIPPEILLFIKDDVEDAIRESQLLSDDICSAVVGKRARRSVVSGVTRCASVKVEQSRMSQVTVKSEVATLTSLLAQRRIRDHLLLYWIASFVSVAIDEGFPLFCISVKAGLGLSENAIGKILSASGLFFLCIQIGLYAPLVEQTGLYGSIKIGAWLVGPLTAVIPISLWLNAGAEPGELSMGTFLFLTATMGLSREVSLAFFSGISVAINRLVVPSHRATLNGLGALGGSFAKGAGPIFAGLLVGFCFSSGFFAPHLAAYVLFGVLGLLSVATAFIVSVLLVETDDDL